MALNASEAQGMIDACQAAGVTLRGGLQCRFEPVLRAAAEICRTGRIGPYRIGPADRLTLRTSEGASQWNFPLKTSTSVR
jgi:predicted dehydrogenase